MLDDDTPRPDWRRADSYRPLLGAEPAVWAWEFCRRGLAVGGGEDAAAPEPDLCFAGEGPAGDPTPAVIWRWRADPSVPVFTLDPAAAGDGDAFDLQALALASLVVRSADGDQHVLVCDGARRLRFAVVEGDVLEGPARLRFRLPARGAGTGAAASLEAVRLLIGLRDTGRLPAAATRAPLRSARWLDVLRAYDARTRGASQRQIATVLFGETRVREDWSGASDYMRMRVHRLLRTAEGLVAGGYRALLGGRADGEADLAPGSAKVGGGAATAVREIWRSPAWRTADGPKDGPGP
jgi:hypothetical protein